MLLYIILFISFFAIIGCRIGIGLWSNILIFINLLFATLIATALYEPISLLVHDADWKANDSGVASIVEGKIEYADMTPFLMIWLIFIASLLLLRFVTDYSSRYKVRFHAAIDIPGRIISAIAIAVLFLGFAGFTIHISPMLEEEVSILFNRGSDTTVMRLSGESDNTTVSFSLDGNQYTVPVNEGRWTADVAVPGNRWGFQQKANSWNFLFGPDSIWMAYCRYASRYPLSEFRGGLLLPEVTGQELVSDARRSIRPFDSTGNLKAREKLKRVFRLQTAIAMRKDDS